MIKLLKYFITTISLSLVWMHAYAENKEFKEGEYYTVIESNELSKTKEITEFFSFYCGHCFMFRSIWEDIKTKYSDVSFKRIPVSFLGGQMGPLSQRAYATSEIMGIDNEFTDALFNQIHTMNKTDYNVETLSDIAAYVGSDKKQFLDVFDSFMSISQVASYNSEIDRAKIKGVPTIMINHKYLIIKAEKDEMSNLINYLLNKDNIPGITK